MTTIGVTDSVKYPGTLSFERFEYPSVLSQERLAELADVAERVLPALGFDDGFFNVEFFVPEQGPAQIIEVNGRIASQFAPLVRRAARALDLRRALRARARRGPRWQPRRAGRRRRQLRASGSSRTRSSRPCPDPEPDLELLVRPGLLLSEQGVNDAQSYRLAILYGVGETREEAVARCRERAAALSFRLAPVPVR